MRRHIRPHPSEKHNSYAHYHNFISDRTSPTLTMSGWAPSPTTDRYDVDLDGNGESMYL